MGIYLTVALTVILLAQEGLALKCYQCASSPDSSVCGDPFSGNSSSEICSVDVGVCAKQTLKAPPAVGSTRETSRICIPVPKEVASLYCDNLQTAANNVGAKVEECSVCSTDYCNGGPKPIGVSLSALLLVIGVVARQMTSS